MERFCSQCGAQHDEGARFCGKCGTPIPVMEAQAPINPQPEAAYTQPEQAYTQPETTYAQPEQTYEQPQYQYTQPENTYVPPQAPKKSNKKTIAIIVGVIALIAAIVITLFATGVIGGKDKDDDKFASPESVAIAFLDAFKSGNAREFINCIPSFVFEDSEAKQEAIGYLEEMFEELFEYEDFEKTLKNAKFTVDEVSELSSYEISLVEDELEHYDFDMDDITDYKNVTVKMTVSYEGEPVTQEVQIIALKYKGEWKIANYNEFIG